MHIANRATFAVGVLVFAIQFPGSAIAATTVCTKVSGGLTAVRSAIEGNCPGCTTQNPGRAIDGNLNTNASITIPIGIDVSARLRALAQRGIVYPAGSTPGVIFDLKKSGAVSVANESMVRTLLNSSSQGSSESAVETLADVTLAGVYRSVQRVKAKSPFNSVEFELIGNMSGHEIRVYEFCSDIKNK